MAKRKFKASLSVDGIEQLKRDLLNYKDNILQQNIREYVSRLLQIGISVSQARINESPLGKYITLSTNISADKMGCKGILIAKGVVKEEVDSDGNAYPPFSTILAVEFGAGIHFNPIPNPNADKFGLGVGTFPGQLHAFEDTWFYWEENEQKWKPTHGVKATMPMYNARMEMANNLVKIAKSVF
jgi:hypothetical protein